MRALLLLSVSVLWFGARAAMAACAPDTVELRGDWGQISFRVDIADTAEERAKGLMFVDQLPAGQGMLFIYPQPRRASFWMKNTLIPLDMIFIDARGSVGRVHRDAVPGDLSAIEGGEDVLAVLEINAGLSARFGIVPGSQVRHPAFDPAHALWPCE